MVILKKTYFLPRPVVRAVISDVVDTDFTSAKKNWDRKDLYGSVSTS